MIGELVQEAQERARIGAGRTQGRRHDLGADRVVAVGDIHVHAEASRAGSCDRPAPSGTRGAPVLEHERGGGDAVRDDGRPERPLDGGRHLGDELAVHGVVAGLEDDHGPDAAARPRRSRYPRRVPQHRSPDHEVHGRASLSCDGPERGAGGARILARRRGRRQSAAGIVPASAGHRAARPPLPSPYAERVQLDDRDLAIVAALQEDARATYSDVAGRIGMSQSAVHDRVRKLESAGVIRGYRAVVAPEALGLFVTALVAATPLDPSQPDDLPERVRGFPEVEDCFSVAGEANYILKVRVRTTTHLEELIRRLRERGGVQTRTTIVLSIPFEDRPLATGDGA